MINTGIKNRHKLEYYNRVELSGFPYLTLSDVENIYWVINSWSNKGLRNFSLKAKDIAVKVPNGRNGYVYQFKDEDALFQLFQKELPLQMQRRWITDWGQLMQYIS